MITPDMIPDEVVDALWRNGYDFGGGLPAQRMKVMRDAIAAAINAWPHMHTHEWQRPWLGGMSGSDIILPLPQEENPDA